MTAPAIEAEAQVASPDTPAALHASRVQRAEAWVRQKIAGHDSSHDWFHIERVTKMAAALAREEGLTEGEARLAELAALLHDVADHKYSADTEADRAQLAAFLSADLALPPADAKLVLHVIDSLGFKEELGRQAAAAAAAVAGTAAQAQRLGKQQGQQRDQQPQPDSSSGSGGGSGGGTGTGSGPAASRERVLAVVQDADRLDAIGAIGIARCLTFGGRFNRVLHDPAVPPRSQLTKEQYADKAAAARSTTLNHFPEKLLRLKDLMRTAAGRRMAQGRHAYMQSFLEQFHAEWRAAA